MVVAIRDNFKDIHVFKEAFALKSGGLRLDEGTFNCLWANSDKLAPLLLDVVRVLVSELEPVASPYMLLKLEGGALVLELDNVPADQRVDAAVDNVTERYRTFLDSFEPALVIKASVRA